MLLLYLARVDNVLEGVDFVVVVDVAVVGVVVVVVVIVVRV